MDGTIRRQMLNYVSMKRGNVWVQIRIYFHEDAGEVHKRPQTTIKVTFTSAYQYSLKVR